MSKVLVLYYSSYGHIEIMAHAQADGAARVSNTRVVVQGFAAEGITARCSGRGSNAIPPGSLAAVHFPYDPATPCDSPDQTRNPDICDVELSDAVVQLALLLEDVFVMHGMGGVSAAHTEEDIAALGAACRAAARRIAPYL